MTKEQFKQSNENYYNLLIHFREKYKPFTIEDCAAFTEVKSQTVRNFEKRVATNMNVVIYYIQSLNNFFDAYNVFTAEAILDRKEMTLATALFITGEYYNGQH